MVTSERIRRACRLCEALEEEIYYGLNLRSTLAEHASEDDLRRLEDLIEKARAARRQMELPLTQS